MNFISNDQSTDLSANSANSISYSQKLSVDTKKLRKQKAVIGVVGAVCISFVMLFGLVSNSSLIGASTTNPASAPNSKISTPITKAAKQRPVQTDGASGSNTAVTSTNTNPESVKNCTPQKSYLKPTRPVANSQTNSVVSSPMITSNYQIFGNTTDQISNQIYSCTPVLSGGSRFAASTDYAISWSVSYRQNSSGICNVASVGVALNQSMVFPEWKPSAGASNQTKQQWQSFIANLRAHEAEHAQINREHANSILSQLKSLPAGNCETIKDRASSKANSIIAKLNSANKALDSHTNHGETTGAHL